MHTPEPTLDKAVLNGPGPTINGPAPKATRAARLAENGAYAGTPGLRYVNEYLSGATRPTCPGSARPSTRAT